jgi:salicylate hydroxylase
VSDRSKEENERFWDGPWVKPVDTQQMLDDFANWDERPRNLLKVRSGPVRSASTHLRLVVGQMIKKPNRWALHECVVLDHWTEGRITLLGDAVRLGSHR